MEFSKYQTLGNDYLVISPIWIDSDIDKSLIQRLCSRRFGIGADGVLIGPYPSSTSAFGLRTFNSDGSECEKSGNGLRLFARYLVDKGHAKAGPLQVYLQSTGEIVDIDFLLKNQTIRVELGSYRFDTAAIPVHTSLNFLRNHEFRVDDRLFTISCVNVGNPHCVVWANELSSDLAITWGSRIGTSSLFPEKANVQFVQIKNRRNVQIEIWERGAGYTLAYGSSACAVAAVCYDEVLVDSDISVHMPGGSVQVNMRENHTLALTGSAEAVYGGTVSASFFRTDFNIGGGELS